tara:strand:- start:65 stop:538 length:474 start_codon:yes stop_codon:yes gene_type:complete
VKVIDNYLGVDKNKNLKKLMESSDFMWLAGDTDINNKELFNFQFSHIFYRDNYINSNYFKNLNDLITKIKPLSLIRIKANLNSITHKIVEYPKHVDQKFKCKIAIYYVNNNNGYTVIDGKKIDSKQDRIVFFNSEKEHYGTSSTNCNNRMIINFNYF